MKMDKISTNDKILKDFKNLNIKYNLLLKQNNILNKKLRLSKMEIDELKNELEVLKTRKKSI